ncbi:MAG: glycosyltransferase family 2 protein [Thermoplasmatota archaeon]
MTEPVAPDLGVSVSVILPVHGRLDTLERAVRSVLDQEGGHLLELLVVDDGSPQDPAPVLEAIGDARIRLLRHDANRGAAAARNTGIQAAKGALLAFQDSDDQWLPGKLQAQVAALADAPDAAFCYSDMERLLAPTATPEPYPAPEVAKGRLIDDERNAYATQDIGIQSCLVRRTAAEAAGPLDEELRRFIDLEWLLRLLQVGDGIRVPRPLVRYHLYGEGISFNRLAAAESREVLLARYAADASKRFRAHQHLLMGRLFIQTRHARRGARHLTAAARLRPHWTPRLARVAVGAWMARTPEAAS